jgi:hypothetical protein
LIPLKTFGQTSATENNEAPAFLQGLRFVWCGTKIVKKNSGYNSLLIEKRGLSPILLSYTP